MMAFEWFSELPAEKQNRIINAGFSVFGTNEYKRASTDRIAAEAGISKGYLFYYFRNKKEFYLFLYERALAMVKSSVVDPHFSEITDFFELMEYAAQRKYALGRIPACYGFFGPHLLFAAGRRLRRAKPADPAGDVPALYLILPKRKLL